MKMKAISLALIFVAINAAICVDVLNPQGYDSGIKFFKIQHAKSKQFLDTSVDGKTFLAPENTNKTLITSQTWKMSSFSGVGQSPYILTHIETGRTLDIGTGSTICTSNSTYEKSATWRQLSKMNPRNIQNNATGLYLDVDDQARLLASTSDKLKNPDWNLVNVPMYFIRNSYGYSLELFRTGSGRIRDKFIYNLRYEGTGQDSAKWYFLDNGNGTFKIVNLKYRYFLFCGQNNKLAVNDKSFNNDNQVWSTDIYGVFLLNKLCNVYLGISTSGITKGMPALSTNHYSLRLELA